MYDDDVILPSIITALLTERLYEGKIDNLKPNKLVKDLNKEECQNP